MSRRIYFDGLNLSLEHGTGIATYTRMLARLARDLGYEVGVVYGSPQRPAKNLLLREIAFFETRDARVALTKELWDAFVDHPLNGTGAGTFGLTDRIERNSSLAVVEPHSAPLQDLTETGIVGFLLIVVAVVAAVIAFRRREREGPTIALGAAVCIVHSLVDIDWDYVAVQGPLFLAVGHSWHGRRWSGAAGPSRRRSESLRSRRCTPLPRRGSRIAR